MSIKSGEGPDEIGTMGGRGDSNNDGIFGPEEYKHHVDYKIQNSNGGWVDPERFWRQNYSSLQEEEYIDWLIRNWNMHEYPVQYTVFQYFINQFNKIKNFMNSMRQFFTGGEAFGRSPLILDLDGDGVETTTINDGAYFDHDKNGFAEQTGWAGADDGLLVWDRNGDGIVNDGKELFGNNTFLKNNTLASNGFQALAEYDDNLDGKIDISDVILFKLTVLNPRYSPVQKSFCSAAPD